jgi:RNA polymerase sigma-70 factor (ECF subfamily)
MPLQDDENRTDDVELARRVGRAAPATDRQAEAELCRRLSPRVRLYGLRHLRDEAAAEDLMQQVMLLTLERLRAGALREPQRLVSFVFGICRNLVLEQRRGHARRDRLLEIYAEALLPPEAPPLDLDRSRLADCLEQLAERERSVLLLTFYDDMSAAALAHALQLSPANVRVIRHRALGHLRLCVTGEAR